MDVDAMGVEVARLKKFREGLESAFAAAGQGGAISKEDLKSFVEAVDKRLDDVGSRVARVEEYPERIEAVEKFVHDEGVQRVAALEAQVQELTNLVGTLQDGYNGLCAELERLRPKPADQPQPTAVTEQPQGAPQPQEQPQTSQEAPADPNAPPPAQQPA